MKRWSYLLSLICALLMSPPLWASNILFINPGKHDELYWQTASSAMQAAARQLGFQLEVSYAERDPLRMVEIAKLVAARAPQQQPDVVIFSNDHGLGPEMLKVFSTTKIKCFMAFSGILSADDRYLAGVPRDKYPHWLGSLVPDAHDAGYLTGKMLLAQGRKAKLYAADGKLHVLAIAGDRSTPSSAQRNLGMKKAIAESADAVLDQMVYANWQQSKAMEQASWLYERYPQAKLVWSGSDLMAFGAMQSWEARGGVVGKTALFSAFNSSPAAMAAMQNGRLSALAGGHALAGAWSLVLIYDYLHGKDFTEGLEMERPMFGLITPQMAQHYQDRYGSQHFADIDFKSYSKALNPALKRYQFSLDTWLK
ncbi:ABC transporter substrate-binding protein [Chitinibacter bivalviorum]|uniref:ABC transporter substrate-binding protein n=2 Tax=Chitinibacter bivalviorum TaxID=2739434 RepID=A0A7H9BRR7_9NEIS|nr:ABC transporter substrate-binding protein [Chitinibacter bivalviorum]